MRRAGLALVSLLSLLGALGLWEAAARLLANPELLPPPSEVFTTGWSMLRAGELTTALGISLARVGAGYLIGVVSGVAIGLLLGGLPALDRSAGLVFEFVKGIPPVAMVPIVIMWMGVGEVAKYVIVAYIVCIVVAISTAAGVREIPLVRLRAGAFFGLSPLAVFLRIMLPSSLPFVISGMRSGIGFAFVALVSAELIGANSGIGHIIMDGRFALQTSRMIVGILVLGAVGALLQLAFDALVQRSKILSRYT